MNEITELRASALPAAFRCPGSVRRASLPIAETNEAADLGNAAHEALRPLAETGAVAWESLGEIASRWGVAEDDVRLLAAMATKLWPQLAPSFAGAMTEIAFARDVAPGVVLSGHVDLYKVTDTVARAADWKTGRKDHDYSQQMRAYGALILLDDPQLTEVTVTVVWLRDGAIENYTVDPAAAWRWLAELIAVVVEWDGTLRPGPHCGYCRRSHECEARAALVRRDVRSIIEDEAAASGALAAMPPAQVLSLYRRAGLVLDTAERVRKLIRAHVEEHGDVVANGERLTLVEESRRELDPMAAWPVLEKHGFRDEDFAEVLDLSISRIEKIVAKRAGRGNGAAAVRALAAALEEADAVGVKTTKKLTERRD